MRRFAAVFAVLILGGCLSTPPELGTPEQIDANAGDATTRDGSPTVIPDGDSRKQDAEDIDPIPTDAGPPGDVRSEQPICEPCTLGEGRCTGAEGEQVNEVCVPGEAQEDCHQWQVRETCEPAQQCSAAEGCHCAASCEVTGQFDCAGEPRLCVNVGGCPMFINACRPAACGAGIDDPMFCSRPENADDGKCMPCDNGRGCSLACPGTDCYTCGENLSD